MQTVLPILILIGIAAAAMYALTRKSKDLDTFRAEASAQFDVWLAGESASQLGLSPGSCKSSSEKRA
jgi:hypothetical protein